MIGPVWPVGAGCYSRAALPMPLSIPLYININDNVKTYNVNFILFRRTIGVKHGADAARDSL